MCVEFICRRWMVRCVMHYYFYVHVLRHTHEVESNRHLCPITTTKQSWQIHSYHLHLTFFHEQIIPVSWYYALRDLWRRKPLVSLIQSYLGSENRRERSEHTGANMEAAVDKSTRAQQLT